MTAGIDPDTLQLALAKLRRDCATPEAYKAAASRLLERLRGEGGVESHAESPPAGDDSRKDARAFADWARGTLQLLADAGQSEAAETLAESLQPSLDACGWAVALGGSGRYEARFSEPDAEAFSERAPKGGATINGKPYKGGMFIPTAQLQATKAKAEAGDETAKKELATLKAAKQASEEGKAKKAATLAGRGDVDPAKLKARLAHPQHAQAAGEAAKWERDQAAASARMLHRHHGPLALQRLDEIATALQDAYDATDDEDTRERLSRRLGLLAASVDLLTDGKRGVTGQVPEGMKAKPAEAAKPAGVPPAIAEALRRLSGANEDRDELVRAYGRERGEAEYESKLAVRGVTPESLAAQKAKDEELIAKAKSQAASQGWAWGDVEEAARKQLGVREDWRSEDWHRRAGLDEERAQRLRAGQAKNDAAAAASQELLDATNRRKEAEAEKARKEAEAQKEAKRQAEAESTRKNLDEFHAMLTSGFRRSRDTPEKRQRFLKAASDKKLRKQLVSDTMLASNIRKPEIIERAIDAMVAEFSTPAANDIPPASPDSGAPSKGLFQKDGPALAAAPTASNPRGLQEILRDTRTAERQLGRLKPGDPKADAINARIAELNAERKRLPRRAALAPAPPALPAMFDPAASYAVDGKEPWEMTAEEWGRALESGRPSIIGGVGKVGPQSFQRGQGETIRQLERAERLRMGLPGVPDPEAVQPVRGANHREVVQAALAAGKPVPPEVLKDYPDLAAPASPADTVQGPQLDNKRITPNAAPVASSGPPEAKAAMPAQAAPAPSGGLSPHAKLVLSGRAQHGRTMEGWQDADREAAHAVIEGMDPHHARLLAIASGLGTLEPGEAKAALAARLGPRPGKA